MKGYKALYEECCENCVHFEQHYVRASGERYLRTAFGHCAYPRMKTRRINESCQYFTSVHKDQPAESGAD